MVFYRNTYNNSRGGNIIEDVPALCLYLSSSLYISHKRPAIIGPDISLPIYQKIWDKSSLFPPMACISNPCNEEPSTSAMFVDPMILVSKLLGMSEAEFRQMPFIVSMRTVLVGIGVLSTGLTSKIKRFITELTKADRRRCLGDTEQPAEKAQRYVIMIRIPPLIVFQRRFCTKILKG